MLKIITVDLGLDDEKRVYLGMVVFKERLAMFMLSRVLETLRDILLIMPLSTQQMQLQSQNEEVKRIKQY